MEAEQKGSGPQSGGGPLALPVHGRGVVITVMRVFFGDVGGLCKDIVVGDRPR